MDLQIPCRWTPDMAWGNGMPLFNFYGPFIYYVGAILSFVVGYISAAKILFLTALIAGSLGVYLLVKEIWGKYAALTSAVLYTLAPYKALDIYVRGALSESVALAIIPFVLYFSYKLVKEKKGDKYFSYTVVSFFFFLITHNIMTVIFVPIVFLWVLYWLYVTNWKNLKAVIYSFLFSFGLSSFFVIPAFFEKGMVQTEGLTRFELDFRANFVSLKKLFLDRAWGYGTSIPGPEGGMSFQIGIIHYLLAFISLPLVFLSKKKKDLKILNFSIFVIFLLSVFMTHNKSSFIWERVSILTFFQFPWRFLSLSIITASLLGGIAISSLKKENLKVYFSLLIIFLAIILNWSYFRPREFYNVKDSEKLTGELWEEQRKGAILDYLPKTALEPIEPAQDEPLIISGEAVVSNFENKSNKWKFDAIVRENSEIHLPVFYFPNWKVYVNGNQYPFKFDNLVGRIAIDLEPGEYIVKGKFKNTPLRIFANTITLLSFIGFIVYVKKNNK